jgi:hypothetical protein
MELLTATLHTVPTHAARELVSGTFERMVVSPYGPLGGIVALSLFPDGPRDRDGDITLAIAAALFGLPAALADGAARGSGRPARLARVPSVCVPGRGAVLIVKQAGNAAAFLISGLALAGGSFFPVSVLPSAVRWISDVQPLTPALELTRHELVGAAISGSAWVAAAKLAAFAVVLLPVSILSISSALKVCRARGTLIEY